MLAAVAIVALAAAAATLPSTTQPAGAGGGGPPGTRGGEGGLIPTPSPTKPPVVGPGPLDWLTTVVVLLALLSLVLYVLVYRREAIRRLLLLAGVLVLVALLFWLASQTDLGSAGPLGWGGPSFGLPTGSGGSTSSTRPPYLLLLVLGVLLVGAVALFLRTGRFARVRSPDEGPEPSEDAAAVGRAAGRAADRIETTDDFDNEIYRAWREMTDLLEVPRPESSTPGEFAAAAVAAGMDADDVDELTRLFEDVRYGGEAPTGSMQRRALTILRRIEATYVPDDEGERELDAA